jgi:hypothetical protein
MDVDEMATVGGIIAAAAAVDDEDEGGRGGRLDSRRCNNEHELGVNL